MWCCRQDSNLWLLHLLCRRTPSEYVVWGKGYLQLLPTLLYALLEMFRSLSLHFVHVFGYLSSLVRTDWQLVITNCSGTSEHFIYSTCLILCTDKNKIVPLQSMNTWGGGARPICQLNIRWRWVVSFTPRPPYHCGKSLHYPPNRRLGGPNCHFGRFGDTTFSCICRKSNVVKTTTSLSRLLEFSA